MHVCRNAGDNRNDCGHCAELGRIGRRIQLMVNGLKMTGGQSAMDHRGGGGGGGEGSGQSMMDGLLTRVYIRD